MCFANIDYTDRALQNTDFGVLHKSSKQFMISIFFPPVEGDPRGTPPPCPTSALFFTIV